MIWSARKPLHLPVVGTRNAHRVSDQYKCGMLRRKHFVDLFRRRLYHIIFIVSHF
jgi:hypothetical protein